MFRALVILTALLSGGAAKNAAAGIPLHDARTSAGDLEVAGELRGLHTGTTRFIHYEDLLSLPQETYTVSDDSNFKGAATVTGIPLKKLAALLGESSDLIVAICYDRYRTNYPSDYLEVHHPLLVLRINGHKRDHWPPAPGGGSLGPYLISHPFFKPAFRILSHDDQPQIPYGVTRIELRRESVVFGAIAPRTASPAPTQIEQGYIIARQDCFRCHNMGAQGGTMAGHSWTQLGAMAEQRPSQFRRIIHDPKSVSPAAKMPAHTGYDDATLDALVAYFRDFATSRRAQAKERMAQ